MRQDKLRERWFVECARSLTADLPPGDMVDSESPDFLIDTPAGPVGVEVTCYARPRPRHPPPATGQQALHRAVVRAARRRARRWGCSPLLVTACLDAEAPFVQADVHEFARAISETVAAQHLGRLAPNWIACLDRSDVAFPNPIARLHVGRFAWLQSHSWAATGAFAPAIDPLEIQAIVSKKELRLPHYRRKAERVWLLIVIEGFRPDTIGHVRPLVRNHSYQSSFAGVVLFDQLAQQCWVLNEIAPSCKETVMG